MMQKASRQIPHIALASTTPSTLLLGLDLLAELLLVDDESFVRTNRIWPLTGQFPNLLMAGVNRLGGVMRSCQIRNPLEELSTNTNDYKLVIAWNYWLCQLYL